MDPSITNNHNNSENQRITQYVYNTHNPLQFMHNNNSLSGQINRTSGNDFSSQQNRSTLQNNNVYPSDRNENSSPSAGISHVSVPNISNEFGSGSQDNPTHTPTSGNIFTPYSTSQVPINN